MKRLKYMKHQKAIDCFTINRPASSCRFATDFCEKYCYNRKFYQIYHRSMPNGDIKDEQFW